MKKLCTGYGRTHAKKQPAQKLFGYDFRYTYILYREAVRDRRERQPTGKDTIMESRRLITALGCVAAALLSSCNATVYSSASASTDDLYAVHDRKALAQQRLEQQARRLEAQKAALEAEEARQQRVAERGRPTSCENARRRLRRHAVGKLRRFVRKKAQRIQPVEPPDTERRPSGSECDHPIRFGLRSGLLQCDSCGQQHMDRASLRHGHVRKLGRRLEFRHRFVGMGFLAIAYVRLGLELGLSVLQLQLGMEPLLELECSLLRLGAALELSLLGMGRLFSASSLGRLASAP